MLQTESVSRRSPSPTRLLRLPDRDLIPLLFCGLILVACVGGHQLRSSVCSAGKLSSSRSLSVPRPFLLVDQISHDPPATRDDATRERLSQVKATASLYLAALKVRTAPDLDWLCAVRLGCDLQACSPGGAHSQ